MKKLNYEAVASHITEWLKSYAQKAGASGYVMGVSGGIDSAVVSTLAAKTGLNLIVLQMPIHQIEEQDGNSEFMINWLRENFSNVSSVKADLTSTFDTFMKDRPKRGSDSGDLQHLTEANTRSRLRMITLYYYGQLNGLLVAGTGNKVEDFGIGFYTKYGDGGVDVSPIADLMKSEVYELGKYLGIPERISNRDLNKPTDGLWSDGRTDEDQIGASYDELEWAMNYLAFDTKTELTPRQSKVLEIYKSFNTRNHHKMDPIPICSLKTLR